MSIAERYLQVVLQLVAFFVLARLLTPEDVGLYSVAAAAIGIAHILRDFGVGSYLVQERELTPERIRTAFTVTLLVSTFLFLCVEISAPWIASFYSDARLETVLRILAFNFVLIPFNSTTMSILKRNLRFNILLRINLTGGVAGVLTSIGLASVGTGYMALVWGSIANTAAVCLGGAIYRGSEFWLSPTLVEWRRVFRFGSRMTAASILTGIAASANDLVLGRVVGFASVGIWSRAQGMMLMFHRDLMAAVQNVAYPGFAKANREGGDIEDYYVRSVAAVTAVAWPFYGFLALFPLESLRVMFGHQWDQAAPLVPMFCLAGAVAAMWNLIMPLLNALGRIDLSTRGEFIVQPMRVALIVLAAMAFRSLMVVAAAYALSFCLITFIFYSLKARALPTNWQALRAGLFASLKLLAFALAAPIAVKVLQAVGAWQLTELMTLVVAAATALASWVLGLRWLGHPLLNDPVFPQRLRRMIART